MNLINFLKRRKLTLETYVSSSFSGKNLAEVVSELSTLGFEVDEELKQNLAGLLTPPTSSAGEAPETSVVESEVVDVPEPVELVEEAEKPVKRNKRSKEQQE